LKDDRTVLTKHEQKEQNIFDFYSNLLGESPEREVTVNLAELDRPNIDLTKLDAPFSEEEVWRLSSPYLPTKHHAPMDLQENSINSAGR